MPRTRATLEALERDMWLCQYHMHKLRVAMDATDGHHMFGRHTDIPEAIVAMCRTCHMKLHNDEGISNQDMIDIQVGRKILTDDKVTRLEAAKIRGAAR